MVEILVERLGQVLDVVVELGARGGVVGDPQAREGGAHGGKIGRGGARVVDRHQRFIERLVDEDAGVLDAEAWRSSRAPP